MHFQRPISEKIKCLVIVLSFLALLVAEEKPAEAPSHELKRMEDAVAKPWQSFSLGTRYWQGDYWNIGPTLLLQKSIDDTIILSWSDNRANALPVVIKILTKEEGLALHANLCRLYRLGVHEEAKVEKMSDEEIDAYIAKTRHSPPYQEMILRTADSHSNTQELSTKLAYNDNIMQPKGAEVEFMQLVMELRPPKKTNESGQPEREAAAK